MIECSVFCAGERIGPEFGSLRLEENASYEVVVETGPDARLWLDHLPLPAVAAGRFALTTGFWVGDSLLRVESEGERAEYPVRVRPSGYKLLQGEWQAMLADVETWLSGASVGMEGGQGGSADVHGGASPQFLTVALLPLVRALVESLTAICTSPRTKDAGYWADVELRRMRKAGREAVSWVSRHPEVGAWLDPWKRLELLGDEPLVPLRRVQETIDHPANRYVLWLAGRAARRLESVSTALREMAERYPGNDSAPWCLARSSAMEAAAASVRRAIRRSPLRHLTPRPPSEAALLVVLDDPVYARFHNLGRLFCSPRFNLDGNAAQLGAPVRPSFELYEIWCFLSVVEGLRNALPGWSWITRGYGRILDLGSSGAGAAACGVAPDGTRVEVEFNAVFPGFFARSNAKRWSLSSERRPDIVLSVRRPSGDGWWACLDAKYRVGRANLGNAFASVHIYRDALVWEDLGGSPVWSFLLSPKAGDDTREWFSPAFRETFARGVWELRPSATNDRELEAWLASAVGQQDGPPCVPPAPTNPADHVPHQEG
ncbi:protein of unknown function DUF524 [Pseudodesulfovibrio mercurii]|uniref:DUF2357 domain-containing protein n=1 Tax=Pseudodesulfovibrio mercurii TaxID=641491 RepID=F0JE37_9BACT|nr:nuclease domain-containing protein [Pseudodesulfovibrio mercurii]EGB14646.1 protein of unknown function DUF524 [Pseudodesulfovibrio mercurii]